MNDGGQSPRTVEELRAERLAALNLMEDAIAARRELERANAALRASEDAQVFLLKFSDAIRPLADPDAIKSVATHVLGERFQAAGVVYGEIEPDRDEVTMSGDYFGRAEPRAGRLRISDLGDSLLTNLRAGRRVVITDTLLDPNFGGTERDRFWAIGMRAGV